MEIAVAAPTIERLIAKFEETVLAHYRQELDELSELRRALTLWEEENLLDSDPPPPEKLAEHATVLSRLMLRAQILATVALDPECPADLAEHVQTEFWDLRQKLRGWHKPMPKEQADRLLKEVFPEP